MLFFICVIQTTQYLEIYVDLRSTGIDDISIGLVPSLALVCICLLYPIQEYSKNIFKLTNLFAFVNCIICIVILFAWIPVLGSYHDITEISVKYWNIWNNVIIILIWYLMTCGIFYSFAYKLRKNEIHGAS